MKWMTLLLAVLTLGLLVGCSNTDDAYVFNYPAAEKGDVVDDYHGTQVADPYRWLEDPDSEETQAWVAAQNEVTFGYLESLPERESFKTRLTELWDYPKYGEPFKEGGRYFFYKNDGLQNQSVLYWQETLDSEPKVLLDPNTLSEDGTVALGDISISRDGRKLAWATNISGSDWSTWYIRDIDTGQDLTDKVEWSKFSGASWDKNSEGFYYSRYDAPEEGSEFESANYYQKLYYHKMGTKQSDDVLVYNRPDQMEWGFSGNVTESGDYLIIQVWQGSSDDNMLFYKDLRRKNSRVVELIDKFDASYGFLGHDGAVFYLITNHEAPMVKIIAIDTGRPTQANWQTIVPEADITMSSACMVNRNEFAVKYMRDAHTVIKRFNITGLEIGELALPGIGKADLPVANREDSEAFYTYTSFLYPPAIFHYDFTTGESKLFRKPEIAMDLDQFTTEQIFFTSKDGTQVPMFVVHKKDMKLDGQNPTLVYGYGGFNVSLQPRFSISKLAWLEKGGVYVQVTLRGGGEYGKAWHEAGMLKNKQNTFDDFIAAGEWLVAHNYTSPAKLACMGGSNGGTLVGAVVNQRPDLWAAAIPEVGVMDMLRFHLFTIGWAWVGDFGSSEDPDMFPTLYAYSPYHNIKDGVTYPSVMITTADHDDRVVPGHSFKYAARIQAAHAGKNPVIIRIDTKSGHGVGKPTDKVIDEVADGWAFLWDNLGM
jgi:prolyl oligopeptidase